MKKASLSKHRRHKHDPSLLSSIKAYDESEIGSQDEFSICLKTFNAKEAK